MNCSFALCLALLMLVMAPVGLADDRSRVSTQVEKHTGYGLRPAGDVARTSAFSLPPGVSIDGSLSEQDAVAIALWNNAGLQATLAELGLARADLIAQ